MSNLVRKDVSGGMHMMQRNMGWTPGRSRSASGLMWNATMCRWRRRADRGQRQGRKPMIPRNPKLTFEDALPHWAPNAAFAQIINAGSTRLPAVETYLNKVMARAAQLIDDPALKQDIALFTAQEGNHYRQHRLFNKLLYGPYPGVRALEEQLGRDYDRQFAEKSLA